MNYLYSQSRASLTDKLDANVLEHSRATLHRMYQGSMESILAGLDNVGLKESALKFGKYVSSKLTVSRDINISLAIGTGAALAANVITMHYAKKYGLNAEQRNDLSRYSETIAYSLVFVASYIIQEREKNKSWGEIGRNLGIMGLLGYGVNQTIYSEARSNLISDIKNMDDSIIAYAREMGYGDEVAAGLAQLALLVPFGAVLDGAGVLFGYINNTNGVKRIKRTIAYTRVRNHRKKIQDSKNVRHK